MEQLRYRDTKNRRRFFENVLTTTTGVTAIGAAARGRQIDNYYRSLAGHASRELLPPVFDQNPYENDPDFALLVNRTLLRGYTNDMECRFTGTYREGFCSYYSEHGCLGCRPDRKMANGERFDENKHTIAIPTEYIPLNQWVIVHNLDNDLWVPAKVTDFGGVGVIADVSLRVAIDIGLETKQSWIRISQIICQPSED